MSNHGHFTRDGEQVLGNHNVVRGDRSTILGNHNKIYGNGCQITGNHNHVYGENCQGVGNHNHVYKASSSMTGNFNSLARGNARWDADSSSDDDFFGMGSVANVVNSVIGSGGHQSVSFGGSGGSVVMIGSLSGSHQHKFANGANIDITNLVNASVLSTGADLTVTCRGDKFEVAGTTVHFGGSSFPLDSIIAPHARRSISWTALLAECVSCAQANANPPAPARPQGEDQPLGDNDPESRACVICLENVKCCAIMDCGHLCCCISCANTLLDSDSPRCPVCREPIASIKRLYD